MAMNIFDRMMTLDRRWVFLFLVIVCVGAYFLSFDIPVRIDPEVQVIYDFVDTLNPGDIVMVAMDYDPNSLAELHPMTYAVMEHCFRKNLKIIVTALSVNGPGMADQALRDIADSVAIDREYNGNFYKGREIVNGVDYAFLGYKPYPALVILGMGQDFRLPFPNDYYGRPIDSLPIMEGVINYDQVSCVINISGTSGTEYWISYGQGRFGFPLALGLTGVMGADYYPYLNSGQIFGIMAGLLGAAQYEELADNGGLAKDGMRVQLSAHLMIILFILLGNIGYFIDRRRKKREGR
ncbi:MAG: hypothetical protein U9R56_03680 [candidate division Zixibacteria bacterium]|nr:hypothetical protein [candidate division Zixibacteria bacterium]